MKNKEKQIRESFDKVKKNIDDLKERADVSPPTTKVMGIRNIGIL